MTGQLQTPARRAKIEAALERDARRIAMRFRVLRVKYSIVMLLLKVRFSALKYAAYLKRLAA